MDRAAAATGGGLAVDLGCGTGVATVELARRGFRVIGVDHSPEMLGLARAKLAAEGLEDRVELRRQDLADGGLPEAEADVVTCQGVLHHLPEIQPCVDLIARTLRPGGTFYISEPCADATPLGRLLQAFVAGLIALRRRLRRRPADRHPESVEAPIRSAELTEALRRAGLEFETEYLTHVPLVDRFLPDRARRTVGTAISRPWRRTRGDIVFVMGTRARPEPGS